MFEYMVIGWGAVLGLLIGHAMSRSISRKRVAQAREQAARRVEDAKEEARQSLRAMKARSRETALQLRTSYEEQERQSIEENNLLQERIIKLEGRAEKKEAELSTRQAATQKRENALRQSKGESGALRRQAKEHREQSRGIVEDKAGVTGKEILNQQSEAIVEEHRAFCADRLRNLESSESDECDRQAKRLMGISLGRYRGQFLTERLSFTFPLEGSYKQRLVEEPQLMKLVEGKAGVTISLNENGESVRMEGGDGPGRELVRRCLARLCKEKKIQDAANLINSLSTELDKELKNKGRQSFKLLGIKPAHPELVLLIGKLFYRTSYTQNQWEHSVESAFVAGLMAAEMGLDVKIARRATLLHDIGKALSHEIEGSHAVIGADLAREYDEAGIIVNAIGSHHGDMPPESPYAYLVAASDAMSGARPGARREMIDAYGDRIGDLENIAGSFPGVSSVHAVQAGREIRVHVDEHKVSDRKAEQLSEEIAQEIAQQLTFPGQIRVTVIREFKAIELAS